jgi:hypothetical protein
MKGGIAIAAVAAMASGASAVGHRHAHELFHKRGGAEEVCKYTTIYQTITGEPTRKLCPGDRTRRGSKDVVKMTGSGLG